MNYILTHKKESFMSALKVGSILCLLAGTLAPAAIGINVVINSTSYFDKR
jgi:hypothetical protein